MLLKAENLTVYYDKILALDDVSIEINNSEVVAVLGRNGAGKTTLLRTIMGFVKPLKGKILFENIDLTGLHAWIRARMRISYVPEGRRLFPYLTVEENLIIGTYAVRKEENVKERLEVIYNLFPKLKERRKQMTRTLSGGEAQMVAIGRALMNNPRLILMDEPSMGLAPKIVDEVFKMIKRLKEEKVTILLAEQNVRKALEIADRIYLMETGRVAFQARSEEARENPVIKKAYLG